MSFHLEKIHLKNFRKFEDFILPFAPGFNLLIGTNGRGKTTILDACAIGLERLFGLKKESSNSPDIRESDVRRKLVRYRLEGVPKDASQAGDSDAYSGAAELVYPAECTLDLSQRGLLAPNLFGEADISVRFWVDPTGPSLKRIPGDFARTIAERLLEPTTTLPLVSYYGTSLKKPRGDRVHRIGAALDTRRIAYDDAMNSVIDPSSLIGGLKDLEFYELKTKRDNPLYTAITQAIQGCVEDCEKIEVAPHGKELLVHLKGQAPLPLEMMSHGYLEIISLAADLAYRAAVLNPHLAERAVVDTPGIVLIDEIDQHLYPKWQRSVVNNLRTAFPKIQFIATTHSPFIIQSLDAGEGLSLINLNHEQPQPEKVTRMSIEDICEELMGMEFVSRSRHYQEMMNIAREYYELLKKAPEASAAEKEKLKTRLDELQMLFDDDPACQAFLKMEREASGISQENS